jgi:predicted  nucleic acid-binding Zn-ribbon protein
MSAKKKKGLAEELVEDLIDDGRSTRKTDREAPGKSKANTFSTREPRASESASRKPLSELSFGTSRDNPLDAQNTAATTPIAAAPATLVREKAATPSAAGPGPARSSAAASSVIGWTEKSIMQSENLRLAQQRILDLEKIVQDLRAENEQLAGAAETLRRRADESKSRAESLESKLKDVEDRYRDENQYLHDALAQKTDELKRTHAGLEEMESRLQAAVQKVRLRERDLENRLEILKVENAALMNNKNNIILDLKRNADQLNAELESYRVRGQALNKQLDDNKDVLRRTVKTLRLALNMLEGGIEKSGSGQKGDP